MWVPCHAAGIDYGESCEARNLQHAHFGVAQARQREISYSSTEGRGEGSSLIVPYDRSEIAAAQHPAAVPPEADQPGPDAERSTASTCCSARNPYTSVRWYPARKQLWECRRFRREDPFQDMVRQAPPQFEYGSLRPPQGVMYRTSH